MTVRTVAVGVAGMALVGAALTGCGSSGSSGSSSSSSTAGSGPASAASSAAAAAASNVPGGTAGPDPCSLVTDAEASQWLGGTATHDPAVSQFRGKDCKFTSGSNFLLVQVYVGKEFYAPKQQAPDATSVSGIGDSAFVGQALSGAIKGNTVVIVGGMGASAHYADALRAAMSRV